MPYLVHADPDRSAMLDAVGVGTIDDLLIDVPADLRLSGLDLAPGLSEMDTVREMTRLAERNRVYADRFTFRGGTPTKVERTLEVSVGKGYDPLVFQHRDLQEAALEVDAILRSLGTPNR